MEVLVIALFSFNLVFAIVNAFNSESGSGSRNGWFSAACGWLCALLGYAAFYGWIGA
jgi:hypothetical protein